MPEGDTYQPRKISSRPNPNQSDTDWNGTLGQQLLFGLSLDNFWKVLSKVCHTLFTWNMSFHQWERLLGSFNHEVAPLHLKRHYCLTFEDNRLFPTEDHNWFDPFPPSPPVVVGSISSNHFSSLDFTFSCPLCQERCTQGQV